MNVSSSSHMYVTNHQGIILTTSRSGHIQNAGANRKSNNKTQQAARVP